MNEWTEIFFTCNETESQLVKNVLESENIQVVIKSARITPYPVNIGRMGEVRLLVRSEDAARAEEVLKVMKEESERSDNDS